MDISSIIGLSLGFVLVFFPILLKGQLAAFIDPASVMIVMGGAISAIFTSYPLKTVLGAGAVIKQAFIVQKKDPVETIDILVNLGEKARREGILALEREAKDIKDDFMKKAIQLAVDGNEVEIIENVMSTEIEYISERHRIGKKILDDMGALAPGFGMLGTLVGLVMMLQSLDDPSNIGAGMAVALITTFYGSLVANVMFIPMANKVDFYSKEEVMMKMMTLAGIISIQSGDNPRVLREKLETFLSPSMRKKKEE
ncbi:MAG: motility protein A [Candidatus Cloacimonetes bacterium]|nr:motility protein A [Candidatus Cloacimonadota bacterium]